MAKSLQRKKPGFTKSGEVKLVSLNISQLVAHRSKISKKKHIAKLDRRLTKLGYVAPAAAEQTVAE